MKKRYVYERDSNRYRGRLLIFDTTQGREEPVAVVYDNTLLGELIVHLLNSDLEEREKARAV